MLQKEEEQAGAELCQARLASRKLFGTDSGWLAGWLAGKEVIIMLAQLKLSLAKISLPGLGNTRGFYCNSNSWGSELQGIGNNWSDLQKLKKE